MFDICFADSFITTFLCRRSGAPSCTRGAWEWTLRGTTTAGRRGGSRRGLGSRGISAELPALGILRGATGCVCHPSFSTMRLSKHSFSCAMTGMWKTNNTVCDVEVGEQTRDLSGERKYGRGRTTGRTDSAINVQCDPLARIVQTQCSYVPVLCCLAPN